MQVTEERFRLVILVTNVGFR